MIKYIQFHSTKKMNTKILIEFETEISETFNVPSPLTIAIDVQIDRIYYQRKLLNFILRPMQIIEIHSIQHIQPTIPTYDVSTVVFPWKKFFDTFNHLYNKNIMGRDDFFNKLLPIICRIPNDQQYFVYEKNITQLVCLCHLFIQNRKIEMTKEQCVEAITYIVNMKPLKAFGFIISTLLRICVLYNYKLTDDLLQKIKNTCDNEVKNNLDPESKYAIQLFSYYCKDVEKREALYLPYLENSSYYDWIVEADSELN